MKRHRLSVFSPCPLLGLLVLVAPALGAASSAPPTFRLPGTARPTSYSVDLTIIPSRTTFSGSVEIELNLRQATRVVWLNATELTVEGATGFFRGKTLVATPTVANEDFVGFRFARAVGPGQLKLRVSYTGNLREKETQGVFRQKDGESWYVFTQFETSDARRAFPCFDEPAFKVPWRLTLRVPADQFAVSNASVESESSGSDRMKTVRFRRTEPLPSYLVAFGVGPFEFVDAGAAGVKKTPIRIVVANGKTDRAAYAAKTTGPILERLERYFGTAYPYEKLDVLSIPQTVFFGAMENAGLITFAEAMLLASPAEQTVSFERRFASWQAHEIAHQWFGDLVTLAWWDDIWLNESFATWMAHKVLIEWKPEWEEDVARVNSRSFALTSDALATAHKVRQPVETKNDLLNAFSAITYGKGAAVLSMFEGWIGEAKFREGIRKYLAAHRFGNATSRDFLHAIEAYSVPGAARAIATFLEQPGAPLLNVSLSCDGERASVRLSQERLLPIGSRGARATTWRVPVCLRFGDLSTSLRMCTLLTEPARSVPLGSKDCPEWLLANDGELGYFRVVYPDDLLSKLFEKPERLTQAELVGVLRDVGELAAAGRVPVDDALELVARFGGHPSRHVARATLRIAYLVREKLVPSDLREEYARFLLRTYSERARALGFVPKSGEDENTRLLRSDMVGLVARFADDRKLRSDARELAARWLENRTAIDAEVIKDVLTVAAENGDRGLFERFREAARKAPERRDRERLFYAMGSFRDPYLAKEALAIYLKGEFDSKEAAEILYAAAAQDASREILWDFAKQNFDAIVAKTPEEAAGFLFPYLASGFCDERQRADVESFLRDRVSKLVGGPHYLDQTLEEIGLCSAARSSQTPSLRAFLETY